jgi:hypothetical protein
MFYLFVVTTFFVRRRRMLRSRLRADISPSVSAGHGWFLQNTRCSDKRLQCCSEIGFGLDFVGIFFTRLVAVTKLLPASWLLIQGEQFGSTRMTGVLTSLSYMVRPVSESARSS